MIRIAICDDCLADLKRTKKMILAYFERTAEYEVTIDCFSSPDLVLEKKQDYHIFFLDILMPAFNGIELGSVIRKENEQALIIYTTSAPEFAIEAFSVRAFGYLLKPINQQALNQTLTDAIIRVQFDQQQFFPVKTKTGITTVSFYSIVYIEYSNHRIHVHTLDRKVMVSSWSKLPFDQLAEPVLSDPCFVKPHISYIIHMRHITGIRSDHTFKMRDGTTIPIAKSVYKEVKQKYLDFLIKLAKEG